MGVVFNKFGREERCIHGVEGDSEVKKSLIVDGSIILKRVSRIGIEVMDWIDLAHDRDRSRALANEVMNSRVP
jgi:hypothetical protein